jgi:RHS repeat-associated protein
LTHFTTRSCSHRILRVCAGNRATAVEALGGSTTALTYTYDLLRWVTDAASSGSASTRLGFTGELQAGTLIYLRARWYNTSSGTFTSRDSFPDLPTRPQSLHRYLYTENNPVNYTDPSGQCRPESLGFLGEAGCVWFWERPQGWDINEATTDYFYWYQNILQNIGLPGAIISDYANALLG